MTAAPPRDFSIRLLEHEEQRHARILLGPSTRPRSLMPRGFRAEDAFVSRRDGFMPLEQAARAMAVSEDEVAEMAARGILLAEMRGATLFVQPAIVSVTAVEDVRHA